MKCLGMNLNQLFRRVSKMKASFLISAVLICGALGHAPIVKNGKLLGDSGADLVIQTCLPPSSPYYAFQQWEFGPYSEIRMVATGGCIDVSDYSTDDQAEVYTWTPCHPEVSTALMSLLTD